MTENADQQADLVAPRLIRFDLAQAGSVYRRAGRPANRRRQALIRFAGRDGDEELFAFEQTFAVIWTVGRYPASSAQMAAVRDYFGEEFPDDATGWQAHTMLCVRDYAWAVVRGMNFTAPRRRLLARFAAAYLCESTEMRTEVRRWNEARHRELGHGIEAGIAFHRPYKLTRKFIDKVVTDMRGAGAEAFG